MILFMCPDELLNVNIFKKYIIIILGAVMSNKSSESEMGNVKPGSQAGGSSAGGHRAGHNEALTAEELRKRRQAYFDR